MKLNFPHFPRFFSAPVVTVAEKLLLWAALALLWTVNLSPEAQLRQPFWPLSLAVIREPQSFLPHLNLAQSYWQAGLTAASRRELLLAQEVWQQGERGDLANSEDHVLGTFTTPLDLWHRWQNEPAQLTEEYRFWQSQVSARPNWRDGYINLATLAWRLNKTLEAKEYLNTARSLDPNFYLLPQLEALLLNN